MERTNPANETIEKEDDDDDDCDVDGDDAMIDPSHLEALPALQIAFRGLKNSKMLLYTASTFEETYGLCFKKTIF